VRVAHARLVDWSPKSHEWLQRNVLWRKSLPFRKRLTAG
jgi:hypothetical protein